MTEDETRILQEAERAQRESDPSFWLHDAHVRMRESIEAFVSEMERIEPATLGQLPNIAHDLLWVLDDLTKLTKQGFRMQPPGPPTDPAEGPPEEDPMEARIAKLEAIAEFTKSTLVEIKQDIREIKVEAKTDFRLLFGALIVVAVGLAGLMARGFHWL